MREFRLKIENLELAEIFKKVLSVFKYELVNEHGEIYIVFERCFNEFSTGEQELLRTILSLSKYPGCFRKLDKKNRENMQSTMISMEKYLQGGQIDG
ncbi:MAG: hypothetical protein WC947_01330 [Elusimicrobiota bacterium]